MVQFIRKKNVLLLIEVFFFLCLITFSIIISEKSLRDWHGPGGTISTDLYIPSIMFACGKGFVNVNPNEIPHLRAFLDFQEQDFSPKNIPDNIQYQELDMYQQYHRHLIYAVGIIWRLFGVSWEVIRWFLILLYTITVIIVYAIARIFLPSYLSVFVGFSFITSEIPFCILPILRDFARAPFILLVLFLLFYLIRGVKTNKRFILFCILLGLTCGIGIGFRRDVLMFFFPSLFILLILPQKENVPKISMRLGGIIVTIGVFLIFSYPILQSFHRYGTLGWHDTLMGIGTEHDDLAGLQRTNYERIPKYHDLLVSAIASVYNYYHESIGNYESFIMLNPEVQKRNLFFAYLYWFPADMLIRMYSAIARISDCILTSALPINLYRSLLSLAILVLLIAINFRTGLCYAIILLYAMSIQTLQFNFRHNFYLVFVPYLLYFLLFYWLILGTYQLWQGGRKEIKERLRVLAGIAKRFTVIAFTIAFFASGALIVARQIQSYQLTQLFKAYHTAELIPLPFSTYNSHDGKTVYALDKPLSPRFNEIFMASSDFRANILVIDFIVNDFPACFETIYDGINNFSCNLTINSFTFSGNTSAYVRYFIPVYENLLNLQSDWNRFIGIRVEDSTKLQVKSISKICDLERIPLLVNYYFIKDELPCLYQKIALYCQEKINPCWKPYGISHSQTILNEANELFRKGDKTQSYELLQNAMKEEPYLLEYGLTLADLFKQAGDVEHAKETCKQIILHKPHDPIGGIKVETLLDELHASPIEKQEFWSDVVSQIPESSVAWLYYAKNQEDTNNAKSAIEKAIMLNKEIIFSTPFVGSFYDLKEIFSLMMKPANTSDTSLCSGISLKEQTSYLLTLGRYLYEQQNYPKALEVFQFLITIQPDFYPVYPPIVATLLKTKDANIETIFYYAKTLISLVPYKIEPIMQIEDIHQNTHYLTDQEWLEIWKDLENKTSDSPCILCGLGQAYEWSQQKEQAEKAYQKAIKYRHKSEGCAQLAYYRLANLKYQSGQKDKAITLLKKAIHLYPNNSAFQQLLDAYQKK